MGQERRPPQRIKQEMTVVYKGGEDLDVKSGYCHDIFQNQGLLMAWRQSVKENQVPRMTLGF